MGNLIYEIHSFPNPKQPFIFHKRCSATNRSQFPNWHENIEILLGTESNGTVHCDDFDISFSAGDIIVLNPNTPHTISSPDKVRYQCLIVDNNFCKENGIDIDRIQFSVRIQSNDTAALFHKAAEAFLRADDSPFSSLQIRTAVLALMANLCLHHSSNIQQTQSAIVGNYVKDALQFIRSHLTKPLTLEEIADNVGISKFHLSRQFHEQTGSSIVKTINMMRCTYARQLLEKGMPVSQAARNSGFENLSYFTRTFRSCIGCLPSELNK